MTPMFCDIVRHTLSIWGCQESLLSMVKPKNLVEDTISRRVPFKAIFIHMNSSGALLRNSLTLYLPHYESQYLVHLQILIKLAQETSSFHTYGVNDLLDLPGEHCVKRRIRRD